MGKNQNLCRDFDVPCSNLACAHLLEYVSFCFATSRLFEIIRVRVEDVKKGWGGGAAILENKRCSIRSKLVE